MVSQRTTTSGGEKPVTAHKSHSEMKQKKETRKQSRHRKTKIAKKKRNMKPRRAKKGPKAEEKVKIVQCLRKTRGKKKQREGNKGWAVKKKRERYVGDFPGPAIVNHAGP